jgi:hypothetical protein
MRSYNRGEIFNFNEITKITECTRVPVSRIWNLLLDCTELSNIRNPILRQIQDIFLHHTEYDLCQQSTSQSSNKFQILLTGTRVHSVIFVISLKLNISPLSASMLTFSAQNHLILTYFIHFDTSHCFYKYYSVSKCVKCIKCRWFCIETVRIEAQKGKIYNFNEQSYQISETQSYVRFRIYSFIIPNMTYVNNQHQFKCKYY